MSGTELIMGMGEVINYLKELEAERDNYKRKWENVKNVSAGKQRKIDELKQELHKVNDIAAERGSRNEALEEEWVRLQSQNNQLQEEKSAMKEELAQKFYKHYDDMGYNKLNIARTIGPNLGRMIEHLIKENKKLQEKTEELQEEREEVWDELEKTKEEYAELKEKNKEFQGSDKHLNKCIDSIRDQYLELKEEIKKLEDRAVADYDTRMNERKKLKEEIFELEMKGNARKDIIKNMFECITADLEEVQDGFTINREWGNKFIDKWNEIVTQEYKDALKDINEQLEGIEWETDGFRFYLNIVEEEDSDDPDEE